MSRTAYKPTAEQKRLVKGSSRYGIGQEDIGREVGLLSPKTLRKQVLKELDLGRTRADIVVDKMACPGKCIEATIYYLNRAAAGRARTTGKPSNSPPLKVGTYPPKNWRVQRRSLMSAHIYRNLKLNFQRSGWVAPSTARTTYMISYSIPIYSYARRSTSI
jgi:hypothetical protein